MNSAPAIGLVSPHALADMRAGYPDLHKAEFLMPSHGLAPAVPTVGLAARCPGVHEEDQEATFHAVETDLGWCILPCTAGCSPAEIWNFRALPPMQERTREPGEDDDKETLSLGVAEFFATCKDKIDWLLAPYVFKGGFTLVQGAPKSGKTWLVSWVAAACASAGHKVLFVEEEGAAEVLRDRLRPFVGDGALLNNMLRVSFRKRFKLDLCKSVDALIEEVRRTGARLVILDPFVALHSKREKEQDEMTIILSSIRQIITETGCAVLLVHHTRKGDSWDKGNNGDAQSSDARGSGALAGDVDHIIAVKGLPISKRKEGCVTIVVENPDTRVGAPFAKKQVEFCLADGTMHEEEEKEPETPEELLERLLPIIPNAPQAIGQQDARKAMRVKLDRLRGAIFLGVEQGLIISNRKGMSRVQRNP